MYKLPDVKYKNFSYPSKPLIKLSFLVIISFLAVIVKEEADVGPVIAFKLPKSTSYNSISFSLYSKFFKRSSALPKCTKFSKWYTSSWGSPSLLPVTVLIKS